MICSGQKLDIREPEDATMSSQDERASHKNEVVVYKSIKTRKKGGSRRKCKIPLKLPFKLPSK